MQQTILKILDRLFSAKQYLQTRDQVTTTTVPGRRSSWIVARSCCIFQRLDFSQIPRAKQQAALDNRIPLISPFDKPGYWVDWQQGKANIWLWDQKRQDSMRQGITELSATTVIETVPESIYTQPGSDERQLWKSKDGFIGQFWRQDKLLGESWWRTQPTDADWLDFLKSVSQPPTEAPQALDLAVTDRIRWQGSRSDFQFSITNERTVMASVGSLFALVLLFQFVGLARIGWHNSMLKSEIQSLTPEVEQAFILRDEYFELRRQNLHLSSFSGRRQLEMMADVADLLSTENITLIEWKVENNELEIVLTDSSPDLNRYVRYLEALGWLSDIRIDQKTNGQIVIRSEILESI
jgi:hypothetical protein